MYVLPLPGAFHIGERNRLGIDAECAGGSQRPELWEGVEDGRVRDAAPAAPVELQPRAAQRGGGERNGRPGHFANLDQADSGGLGLEVMAGECLEQNFRRVTPQIVQNDVEPLVACFAEKGSGQLLIPLVERDDRIRAQVGHSRRRSTSSAVRTSRSNEESPARSS